MGCDLDVGTACKTPFDWRTLKIIQHSRIQTQPRTFSSGRTRTRVRRPRRTMSDRIIRARRVGPGRGPTRLSAEHINRQYHHRFIFPTVINGMCRLMNEFLDEHHRRGPEEYSPQLYFQLRVLRVRGTIDDKAWCRELSAKETMRQKRIRLDQIKMSMVTIVRDTIQVARQKLLVNGNLPAILDELMPTLIGIRTFINEQLARHANGEWAINNEWQFVKAVTIAPPAAPQPPVVIS